MAKRYTDEKINEWRKQAGFKTTTEVIAEEKRQREGINAQQITMNQAEQLMSQGSSGGENRWDKLIRIAEQIERNTRNNGRIG